MKRLKVTALLLVSAISLCGCPKHDDWHKEIVIVNNSDKTIIFSDTPAYMEGVETWACDGPGHWVPPSIQAGDSFILTGGRKFAGYEGVLDKGQTVNIIVGDRETWMQYRNDPCEVIRENVPILHRYQLTLADLHRMNWTVVYPPED